jgi:alanine-glyoxylate transaminase/serine-glyoxylate transaminase/serine-pyruvate transaminase
MSKPLVGHLDAYFLQVNDQVRQMLRQVFGTQNPLTYALSGTGSAGMEAAVTNFVEPGTKVAVLANGYFCDRQTEMARRHGAQVVRLEKAWGDVVDTDEAADFIRRERPQVVMYVQAETSTGAYQQGRTICAAAHAVDALVIADTVTSLGAMPVQVDETGIDIAYSCTQKGLSAAPGLSPITISPRAGEWLKKRTTPVPSWYLDLRLLDEYYGVPHRYHHTASATLFYGLHQALQLILEEGLENRWERHHRAHLAFVKGLATLGLEMHVAEGHRIHNLNTPKVPAGVDEAKVRATLLAEQGIEIAGGFGPLAGKIFRIGLMGPLATEAQVQAFLRHFASALAGAGYKHAGAASGK